MFLAARSLNIVLVLGMIPLGKKIDFNDPIVLNSCRAAYVISNLLIAGLYFFVYSSVQKKNGAFPRRRRLSLPRSGLLPCLR